MSCPKIVIEWDKAQRCACPLNEQIETTMDIAKRFNKGIIELMTIDFCLKCAREIGTTREWKEL